MNNKGFSLVELAISVMVIGILIGGVVKGREVIDSARLAGLISGLNKMKQAETSFEDLYGYLPGDFPALDQIAGCMTGNTNNCAGGNGDGLVGSTTAYAANIDAQAEPVLYWKHLALAGMINNVIASAPIASPENDFKKGVTHPSLYPNTATMAYYVNHGGDAMGDKIEGNIYRIQSQATHGSFGEGRAAMTPLQAKKMDRKLDDGFPDFGNIQVESQAANCDDGAVVDGKRTYQVDKTTKNCTMWVKW